MNPTDQQRAAIDAPINENIFAIAGPGSGKTRTLVLRVLRLIELGVTPSAIACITFTNAGAQEMQKRLSSRSIPLHDDEFGDQHEYYEVPLRLGFIGTLHSFCLNLIRQHGRSVGYPNARFSILDNEETVEFFQSVIAKFKWEGTAKAIATAIAKGPLCQDSKLSPEDIVAAGYWQELRKNKLLTFDAVLVLGERLLQSLPPIGLPFTHYHIDEIQDSSEIDFRIYELLPGAKFIVGDVDQSIFGFRGARPDIALRLLLNQTPDSQQ